MPALREHVHGIAARGRVQSARRLASGLCAFAVSTALLLRDQGALGSEASDGVRAAFEAHAEALKAELGRRCEEWGEDLRGLVLDAGLAPRLKAGAAAAELKALTTADGWGAKAGRAPGSGLYWSTYKARSV